MANDFASVNSTIQDILFGMVGSAIERNVKKIETAAINLQTKMFKYLANSAGLIGYDKAPTFDGITLPQPTFKDLSTANGFNATKAKIAKGFGTKAPKTWKSYAEKKKQMGYSGNAFFLYKGVLQRYLSSQANPVSMFGKPVVTFLERGNGDLTRAYNTAKGQRGNVTVKVTNNTTGNPSKKQFMNSGLAGRIVVNLFPKVKELTTDMNAGDYFPRTIAYRIDNFHGQQNRYFLGQYMEWWMTVKGNEMLRKTVGQ